MAAGRGIRVLVWNLGGGPSDQKLDWLEANQWDVAVLLEVSIRGAARLPGRFASRSVLDYMPSRNGRGRRMMVAVCARPGVELGPAYAPAGFEYGEPFAEQCMAVDASAGSEVFTVVGFHGPNAADRGQSSKEAAYERLARWLGTVDRPTVVAADTNTWTVGTSVKEGDPRAELWHQERFQQDGVSHRLKDAYRAAALNRAHLADPDACWTYRTRGRSGREVRMDKIFVPEAATVVDAAVDHTARGPGLSDHAAVWVEFELPQG